MAKACPQNELQPAIFTNLQLPPADLKSFAASGGQLFFTLGAPKHVSEPRQREKEPAE